METRRRGEATRVPSWWSLQALLIFVVKVACIAALPRDATNDRKSYGVVIDAGSSGSRARLFSLTHKSQRDALTDFNEFNNKKVEPGISAYKTNLDGLKPYLKKLIDDVKDHIPADHRMATPIYLMATAGMRLLLEPRANAIMEKIQEILSDPDVCPFQFHENNARILSGEEEGVFAWISANYLNRYFDNPDGRRSSGILELGGASTQIAFVPDGSILAHKFPVRIATRTFPLYVHSYLYYGQNYADFWVKEYLHRVRQHDRTTVTDPCMLKGDTTTFNISNTTVTFEGSGEPHVCSEIISKLVYKVEQYKCYPKPCAIGPVYQPTISADKNFFALSAFAFPLRTLNVMDANGTFTPKATYEAALTYCQKDINVIINETQKKPDFLSVECLMGLYIPILLTKGYGLANDSRQVAAKFDINGHPAEWPLGAMIYESERTGQSSCSKAHTLPNTMMLSDNGATHANKLYQLFIISAMLVFHHVFSNSIVFT